MKKTIDFDNADICMLGLAALMLCLVIVAGTCHAITWAMVLPFLDKLLIAFMTLVTPGGLAKIVKAGQAAKAARRQAEPDEATA